MSWAVLAAAAAGGAVLLLPADAPADRLHGSRSGSAARPTTARPRGRVVTRSRGRGDRRSAGGPTDADLLGAAGLAERLAALLGAGVAPPLAWRHAARSTGVAEAAAEALAAAVARGEDLAPLLHRAGLPGAEPVVASWALSQRTGAPAGAVLGRCGASLRETLDARAAVRSALAGPRASARVVAALPLLGLVLATALGTSPWAVLVGTWPGRACAVTGVAAALAGHLWSTRLVRTAESVGGGAAGGTRRAGRVRT